MNPENTEKPHLATAAAPPAVLFYPGPDNGESPSLSYLIQSPAASLSLSLSLSLSNRRSPPPRDTTRPPRHFPLANARHRTTRRTALLPPCSLVATPSLVFPSPLFPGFPCCCDATAARPTYLPPPPRASPRGPNPMGKYMRKVKASGEVAVMEVPGGALLGVRTRSRTLALQRAQQRPPEKGGSGEMAEYLELRSRRLEKPPQPQAPKEAARRSAGKKASAGVPAEAAVEDQVSFGENVLDFDAMERSIRETTPCSLIRNSETIRTPGSTTKSKTSNSMTSHHGMEASLCHFVPTSIEMEEFFAASEQQAQHAFKERYNFCPVNDCPLPGRYEWVRLDCERFIPRDPLI